jgi:hypothetical protein
MRKKAALIFLAVTAFGLCAFGLIVSYNFWVAPADRVAGIGFVFFGPAIVSTGHLLLLRALFLAVRRSTAFVGRLFTIKP